MTRPRPWHRRDRIDAKLARLGRIERQRRRELRALRRAVTR